MTSVERPGGGWLETIFNFVCEHARELNIRVVDGDGRTWKFSLRESGSGVRRD